MREELDKQLVEKYPEIFANRYADMQTTAMCWGFDHNDGWYNIIDQLCGNIQEHIDWCRNSHAWDIRWNEEHPENQRPLRNLVSQVVADQVKEKFGTLRFYYSGGDEYISGFVSMAESMSAVTCETCGNPGRARGQGWITTLCQKHHDEQEEMSLIKQGFES